VTTENAICGCDESKMWRERAQHAETKLQLVHAHVKGIGRRVADVVAMVEEAFPVTTKVTDSEYAEVEDVSPRHACVGTWGRGTREECSICTPAKEGDFTELTDESERRVPGEYREDVLASGKVEATANWMAGLMPPKSERP